MHGRDAIFLLHIALLLSCSHYTTYAVATQGGDSHAVGIAMQLDLAYLCVPAAGYQRSDSDHAQLVQGFHAIGRRRSAAEANWAQ